MKQLLLKIVVKLATAFLLSLEVTTIVRKFRMAFLFENVVHRLEIENEIIEHNQR